MKTTRLFLIILMVIKSMIDVKAEPSPSSDQNSIIKGVLTELNSTNPVGYANVILYRQTDSTMVTWTISKEDGSFELSKIPTGVFKLVTTFLGYEKNTLENITINEAGMTLNVGKITLKSVTATLGEITVVSERKTVDSRIDRKIINISKDINSAGGTATDLLRTVPNLNVNTDGTVSLRGNTDVSILIDGRPTSIDATRLDQISSSEIESIEIITSPTAKYNPEGKSGIINLKMKKKDASGLNVNTLLTAGTRDKYNTGIGLNYNFGRINLFASYNGIFRKTNADRYLLRESFISDSSRFLKQNAATNLDSKSNKITVGADITVSSKNSLTMSYAYNPSKRTDYDNTLSTYYDKSMNLTQSIVTDNSENIEGSSRDFLMGYKKTFDKKGEELTVDYNYAGTSEKMNQLQVFHYSSNSTSSEIFNNSDIKKSNLQINWVLPVGKASKIESGIQSIIRNTNIDYSQNNQVGGIWTKDEAFTNNFTYNERIHSIYATFNGKTPALSYIAGLRLEQTYVKGKQTVNSDKIKQDYFNVYPTLNLKYTIGENSGLQFGYSHRINRPNGRQINPFIDKSNLEVYRSGNPDLKPEYINSFEAGYNFSHKKANAGLTLFYNYISDLINNINIMDSLGISHMFPQNVSKSRNYGFEFTYEQPVTKWWKLAGNGSFYRNEITGNSSGMSNSNYSYNARLNNTFTPVKNTLAQLVMMYTGPIIAVTSEMKPQFSVDLAVKRDFLKNKLSLTARATDLFNTLKNSYTTWGNNFTADNWRKPESRVFYFTILYNFGKNGSAKASKTGENNESVHSKDIN